MLPAQAHETDSQNLRYLDQALVGGHQIGLEGVGAGTATIEFVATAVPVSAHP